jgi:asparagine synthase (glutamine-hydrolysing)
MCGITGFVRTNQDPDDPKLIRSMGDAIAHRGPDASGEYVDDFIALGHRRLSIIDLSQAGNQPMFSVDNNLVIVFNGEIYNFIEIRKELDRSGHIFRTKTDTEVILKLYEIYGKDCLSRLNGMFAFAIWDRIEKKLFLATDRIGKKPLYYYWDNRGSFCFASEIKSLLKIPYIDRVIEPTALVDYLKYLYIPAPKSIYKNIYKLPPGHCMEFGIGSKIIIEQYWDIDFSKQLNCTDKQAADGLYDLLRDSTACRMIADVPLGAFLSGGIDSSGVTALMSKIDDNPVKTCSIGFSDKEHDETPFAKKIAELYKTLHKEYFVTDSLVDTVKILYRFFDEPFADSSAIPTYHVSRLARKSVTVALAGDGGDENFGGYEKYLKDIYENQARRYFPRTLLQLLLKVSKRRHNSFWRKTGTLCRGALLDPALSFYATNTFIDDEQLQRLLSISMNNLTQGYRPSDLVTHYWDKVRGADVVTGMLYTDLKTYLPGDILVKVDRMSMAHALEVRAPLLDYRIIEYAARLPSKMKIRNKQQKYILKKSLSRVLPKSILYRQKHGFTVPLDSWFRKDLRDLAYTMLFESEDLIPYFSIEYLKQIWDEHQTGRNNYGTLLWSVISFALWHKEYMH